jgi:drug/metabolite transporter (DMT)-like permease
MELRQNPFGPSNLRHWLIIRGLAGATSLYFRYWALHYMSIADATVIALSMPVFVCIFARIFLKEPFGLFHVLALFLTLIGITFTSKIAFIFVSSEEDNIKTEDDNRKRMIGLIISLGATIIGSSIYVIIRKVIIIFMFVLNAFDSEVFLRLT